MRTLQFPIFSSDIDANGALFVKGIRSITRNPWNDSIAFSSTSRVHVLDHTLRLDNSFSVEIYSYILIRKGHADAVFCSAWIAHDLFVTGRMLEVAPTP
jgi:hypothetical protein